MLDSVLSQDLFLSGKGSLVILILTATWSLNCVLVVQLQVDLVPP